MTPSTTEIELESVVLCTETRTTGWPFTRARLDFTVASRTEPRSRTMMPRAGSTRMRSIPSPSEGTFLVE